MVMRFSCRVWAMRGPMPLTNCRDVSRVNSTSAMLSADSGHGAMPRPQPRTWDDNDLFPVLYTGAPQTGNRVQKARKGRSLPDFLLSFLAPPNLMRLSLMKAAHVGVGSAP